MQLNAKEKKMISKELLRSVIGYGFADFKIEKNTVQIFIQRYCIDKQIAERRVDTINIYELAHKCKEWALCNGYVLNSGLQNNEGYKNRSAYAQTKKDGDSWVNTNRTTFLSSTELEAILKACQWILDNKDKK